jgi:hypothetical protein
MTAFRAICKPIRAECNGPRVASRPADSPNSLRRQHFWSYRFNGTLDACKELATFVPAEVTMDLSVWITATLILGLVALALMFAFLLLCDKV